MADIRFTVLEHRGLLTIAGEDRRAFLQGLVSNDVTKATADHAVWAALLTPQGKFLHEFFIVEMGETLFLEAEQARLDDLKTRLARYRLRAKVQIAVAEGWEVAAVFGTGAATRLGLPENTAGAVRPLPGGEDDGSGSGTDPGIAFTDPRLATAPVRVIVPAERAAEVLAGLGAVPAGWRDHEALRIGLGLPDGSRDIEVEKGLLLESGFDELNGVDFKKGCYVGQELTARTKYRGLTKKRLLPVTLPPGHTVTTGTPLLTADGKEAGEIRTCVSGRALALVRLEHRDGPLTADGATVTVDLPDWVRLPQPKEAAGS